ncbi:hypothetical protein SAMN02982989_3523 [Xaviernesmea oryzae]|uniref:Uncharacterized protein n=1 Tax=Xaviernesmea oryzae TaxID=464029 RepID=A0A1X7GAR0_9HYPH|nr:hypothetical protein [Xaviernesmea oryzae]SMF66869.1 hypothetical protein SAMN02982989_3523 [Xaviernesmea oryzae]
MNIKTFAAGFAALTVTVLLNAQPVLADDKPLIWQPSKGSDTSYSVKLGLKLPTRLEPEAGVSMGVNTTKSGTPVDTPIKFWSSFTATKIQTPAYEANRDIGFDLDGNNGNAAITMNYYEKHVATPTIDIERRSSYVMRYDGTAGDWCGVDTTQSIRLSHSPSRTAVIARASGGNGFKVVGAGLGVEKNFGRNLTISGALDKTSGSPDPIAGVKARYSFKW